MERHAQHARPELPPVVPFSVADIRFHTAPEIVDGLKRFIDTAVLRYIPGQRTR